MNAVRVRRQRDVEAVVDDKERAETVCDFATFDGESENVAVGRRFFAKLNDSSAPFENLPNNVERIATGAKFRRNDRINIDLAKRGGAFGELAKTGRRGGELRHNKRLRKKRLTGKRKRPTATLNL